MKRLTIFLLSGALIAASGSSFAGTLEPTNYCYGPQGQQIPCAPPHYEGRSQANGGQADGIDPLWAGAGLLLVGGGIAAGLAASNNGHSNTLPFFLAVGASP